MRQGAENNNRARPRYRRHGILGWYFPNGRSLQGNTPLEDLLASGLQASTCDGAGFSLAGTGDTCALPGEGAVAVAGRPWFRDSDLADLASREGPAAAVAAAWRESGTDLFAGIGGAFSLCVLDAAAGRVVAGIDRLGQHALYYGGGESGFYFGSEARAALACGELEASLNRQGIYDYVYFHMVPSPDSVFSGPRKLPAAHYVEFSGGKCRLVNYWLPKFSENRREATFEQLSGELKDVLRDAVRRAVPAGARIGAFLSGGLDSSTVTGVMSELFDGDAQAYSIGFSADGYDEMAYARITAEHFGTRINEYYVTPEDVVTTLPLIATSYDEPFGNSSALPAYFCARMAAENGVDTLLAGDGGDELFAGNERYLRQRVFEHYGLLPRFIRRGLVEPLARALPAGLPLVPKANSYIAQANTPLPDRLQSYNFLHRHEAAEIFSAEFLAHVDTELPLELQRDIFHRPAGSTDLNRMLYLDWQITLADNDLRKVSHMCAVAGVDVTYPMLDDALVEFSCRVPSAWKIRGDDLRHFFKRALTGWLPHDTIHKDKKGFGLPFGVWMQTYKPLRELAYDNLLKLKERDFIRPGFIDRAIDMHQSEHAAYYGELVWIFTVFELWLAAQEQTGRRP